MFDFSCISSVNGEVDKNLPDKDCRQLKIEGHDIEFKCQIGDTIFPFLADHCVYETAIVPAAAFLEMVCTVAKVVLSSDVWILEDFIIQKALLLAEHTSKTVYLSLNTQEKTNISFQISSALTDEASEQRTVHVSGRLRPKRPLSAVAPMDLQQRCQQLKEVSVTDYYHSCRERGISYGPMFQVVENLWQAEQEALGSIHLPTELSVDSWHNHPVLLDSCLQVLWAALPPTEDTYLPVGIERVTIYGAPPVHCWSYARLKLDENTNPRTLTADLYLLDEQGTVCVELTGVLVEQVSPNTLLPQVQQTIAIAATFTADPIDDSLNFWMQELRLPYQTKFAPYNQVFQTLLSPNSVLGQNKDGVNVILARLEDWTGATSVLPLQVDKDKKVEILTGQEPYQLPNQLEVAHLNQYETDYLYQELFIDQVYLKHGIVLKDDDCVVDVGANIGLFTLFAQQKCPNGSIYAFEPAPHAFDKLARNAALYCKNVTLFQCGLSSENSSATFTFYPNSSVFSSFSAEANADKQAIRAVILNMIQRQGSLTEEESEALAEKFLSKRLERETYQAQLRTLSSVIEDHTIERIDLLKLDAEKSELAVLQGIKDEHWPKIQQMVVEVHDQVGNVIAKVKQLIQSKGFNLVIDEEDLLQSSGLYNIYATRSSAIGIPQPVEETALERNVHDFSAALQLSLERTSIPHMVCLCPGSPTALVDFRHRALYQRIEALLTNKLEHLKGVHLIDKNQVMTTYAVADYDNPHGREFGHVPYNSTFFTALGTAVARKLHGSQRHPYKVIVLNCDNTLWQGVCGEVGVQGINIEAPYRALQSFMVDQHKAGMLLCLCSKNNSSDVWDVFYQRSDMTLKADYIVRSRINWQPKSENIKSLAAELQLGLESVIFIDDNPMECAEVQANCPEVLTLQLPSDTSQIPRFLHHIWAFDHFNPTAEDKQRTQAYKQNIQREDFHQGTLTFKDFLDGLNLQVEIVSLTSSQLPRVSQLTQRTNQFNFTTVRSSENEIQRLCTAGQYDCLVVNVRDRFGDYGLVGAMVFKLTDTVLDVHTFLLSCRALGRGVEYQMMAQLGAIAQEKGLSHVQVPYAITQKNQPAFDFLETIGATYKQKTEDGWQFQLPTEIAVQLTYTPEHQAPEAVTKQVTTPVDNRLRHHRQQLTATFNRIATELFTPQQIRQQIADDQQRARPQLAATFVAPTNSIEAELANIWAHVLGLADVGVHDNFFELGGRSLLMVQIHSRLRERFVDSDLSPVELFKYPTIHSLAQRLQKTPQPTMTQGNDRAERKIRL